MAILLTPDKIQFLLQAYFQGWWLIVDGTIFLMMFIGLSQLTFERAFKTKKAGGFTTGFGIALAIAMLLLEGVAGFNLFFLSPIVALVICVALWFFLYHFLTRSWAEVEQPGAKWIWLLGTSVFPMWLFLGILNMIAEASTSGLAAQYGITTANTFGLTANTLALTLEWLIAIGTIALIIGILMRFGGGGGMQGAARNARGLFNRLRGNADTVNRTAQQEVGGALDRFGRATDPAAADQSTATSEALMNLQKQINDLLGLFKQLMENQAATGQASPNDVDALKGKAEDLQKTVEQTKPQVDAAADAADNANNAAAELPGSLDETDKGLDDAGKGLDGKAKSLKGLHDKANKPPNTPEGQAAGESARQKLNEGETEMDLAKDTADHIRQEIDALKKSFRSDINSAVGGLSKEVRDGYARLHNQMMEQLKFLLTKIADVQSNPQKAVEFRGEYTEFMRMYNQLGVAYTQLTNLATQLKEQRGVLLHSEAHYRNILAKVAEFSEKVAKGEMDIDEAMKQLQEMDAQQLVSGGEEQVIKNIKAALVAIEKEIQSIKTLNVIDKEARRKIDSIKIVTKENLKDIPITTILNGVNQVKKDIANASSKVSTFISGLNDLIARATDPQEKEILNAIRNDLNAIAQTEGNLNQAIQQVTTQLGITEAEIESAVGDAKKSSQLLVALSTTIATYENTFNEYIQTLTTLQTSTSQHTASLNQFVQNRKS